MTYPLNTTDKTPRCGPWVIENVKSMGGSAQQYAIYSVPDHIQLAKYYMINLPSDSANIYVSFTQYDLRKFAIDHGHVDANRYNGWFVSNQTAARDAVENVLKMAGYKIVDPKFAALT